MSVYAEAVDRHGGKRAAADALGISRHALNRRLKGVEARTWIAPRPVADPLPDADLPIGELINYRRRAFAAKRAHTDAKRWRKVRVPSSGPYALMFFGDPHLDDDGCDLALWEDHCSLARDTEHLYAVNIGDTTNNWAGKLEGLWAKQDASAHTAKRLARYYLSDFGVPWFLWLHGNHDLWSGPASSSYFEAIRPTFVTMEDWQAKVTLVSPNGHELRLWAAHNFKGSSIWNNLHGLERAAQMQDWAHLYVAGHHHDAGVRQNENAHRNFVYNLLRVRGYKFIDDYADLHQFPRHKYGAAGVAIVDPDGEKLNAVTCFMDPHEGVDFLQFKRRKMAA